MDANFASIFYEIAVLVLLAAAVGFVGLWLRQPLVVAFIAVGVLAGPDALGLVSSTDFIETLSQISIAVLLFLVGLKLDVGLVRSLGRVAVATGLGQVTFTAVFGFLICLMLGLDPLTSLYISVALTFSSTIIIVKLLSDKQEIGALHGKIALGFLIVQTFSWCWPWSRCRPSGSARATRRVACGMWGWSLWAARSWWVRWWCSSASWPPRFWPGSRGRPN